MEQIYEFHEKHAETLLYWLGCTKEFSKRVVSIQVITGPLWETGYRASMFHMEHASIADKKLQKTKHLKTGELGELIAKKYLCERNYVFLEQNYRKKWGEIDLILQKEDRTYFIEVKSVSYETLEELHDHISHETYRPEERVDTRKLHKLSRTIGTWIAEQRYRGEYQLDVAIVRMVPREKYATVDIIEKIYVE